VTTAFIHSRSRKFNDTRKLWTASHKVNLISENKDILKNNTLEILNKSLRRKIYIKRIGSGNRNHA
jgi:hypothetical protein